MTLKGFRRFGLFVQDYGGPVGFRLVEANPDALEWLIVQNSNAYEVGFSPAWDGPSRALEESHRGDRGAAARLLARETIKTIYLHGSNRPELVSPDAWESDIALLQRPHAERLHLDLFYDYRTNVPLYPRWQAFLRERQPETLIFWGQGDIFFTPAGGDAYLADLPSAEIHRLDAGHFAVEEHLDYVAKHIELFYSNRVSSTTRSRAA